MSQPALQVIVEQRPASDASQYGYPTNAAVLEVKNSNFRFHVIYGDPTDTMTSAGLDAAYANAPNGSLYIATDGATTKKIAIKFGTAGLKDGSFLFSSAAYATV